MALESSSQQPKQVTHASNVGLECDKDLVAKLTNGKKKRETNIYYTIYLSLIFEHLLGNAYKNDKLKSFKPHHISATSFKIPSANGPVGQSKASTDKKSRKKKNPSSSQPKTLKIVRESTSKKQVAETQHAEVLVATVVLQRV
ncbi:hypothetical protein Tco_1255562 [Tanacetum coccineum]